MDGNYQEMLETIPYFYAVIRNRYTLHELV